MTPTSGSVAVKVLAINDFHGNLLPPAGGIKLPDPQNPDKTITLEAGGAERMATVVAQIKAKNPNHVFVAAGDLVGASPLLSALFHDESTIESLGMMGLDISSVGNHEFDQGIDELLRKQHGGCHPKDGCKGPTEFKGASTSTSPPAPSTRRPASPCRRPTRSSASTACRWASSASSLKGTAELVSA